MMEKELQREMADIHFDSTPRCICICFPWSCKIKRVSPPPPKIKQPIPDPSPAAALVIQKSYRGFLVRKDLRTVRIIAEEVEEIAREAVIPIGDGEERKRLVGMLNALQLRLRSVRDVNQYRSRVICRVVQLQEAVYAGEAVEPLPEKIRSPKMGEGTSSSAPAAIQKGVRLINHATEMINRLAQQVERLVAVQRMEQQEGKGNPATC